MNIDYYKKISYDYKEVLALKKNLKKICTWMPVCWLIWFFVIGFVIIRFYGMDPQGVIPIIWALGVFITPFVWAVSLYRLYMSKKEQSKRSEKLRNDALKALIREFSPESDIEDSVKKICDPVGIEDNWHLRFERIRFVELGLLEQTSGKSFSEIRQSLIKEK